MKPTIKLKGLKFNIEIEELEIEAEDSIDCLPIFEQSIKDVHSKLDALSTKQEEPKNN